MTGKLDIEIIPNETLCCGCGKNLPLTPVYGVPGSMSYWCKDCLAKNTVTINRACPINCPGNNINGHTKGATEWAICSVCGEEYSIKDEPCFHILLEKFRHADSTAIDRALKAEAEVERLRTTWKARDENQYGAGFADGMRQANDHILRAIIDTPTPGEGE